MKREESFCENTEKHAYKVKIIGGKCPVCLIKADVKAERKVEMVVNEDSRKYREK
jgi:hypothetical protein